MDDHGRTQENQPPPSGGERSAGGVDQQLHRADPEVPEKPVRRTYTAQFKLRILDEAEACKKADLLRA